MWALEYTFLCFISCLCNYPVEDCRGACFGRAARTQALTLTTPPTSSILISPHRHEVLSFDLKINLGIRSAEFRKHVYNLEWQIGPGWISAASAGAKENIGRGGKVGLSCSILYAARHTLGSTTSSPESMLFRAQGCFTLPGQFLVYK